ncbi:FAD-dependent thymidylate synthase [Moraxella nasibovis]|uniref:FAD-dependent thymidylate synthase n=1 Tax=Moraxella nasibovis TaxID=2904120 RepID=UPI00240FE252|nr:FAD-dependent thymidylate synthase [Moraxella nasibovis]WFF39245.1 FAD-dependent thymidylate synthase [Moraxella nasibovis]
MIKATIIADSVSAHTGQRITTFELEYHRYIHSELMTHRQFSRNAASSRAIPIRTAIDQVGLNPAMPIHWGLNQAGMQAKDEQADVDACEKAWCEAADSAIYYAFKLERLGLHKQVVNRILEPFQMMKTLVTATSFDNFFNLRCHTDAQPEIKQLADLMYGAMQESEPEVLYAGEWHTPYVRHSRNVDGQLIYIITDETELPSIVDLDTAIKISCSCAAQVSYRKNDTSIEKAISLYDRLVGSEPVHASAFEHCATPIDNTRKAHAGITHWSRGAMIPYSGNFTNWVQYRQLIPNHDCKGYIAPKGLRRQQHAWQRYLFHTIIIRSINVKTKNINRRTSQIRVRPLLVGKR